MLISFNIYSRDQWTFVKNILSDVSVKNYRAITNTFFTNSMNVDTLPKVNVIGQIVGRSVSRLSSKPRIPSCSRLVGKVLN